MIPIYYKSSEGVIVNLIEKPYMMLSDTELLNSKWTPVTAGTNNPKIVALKQEQQSPPFSIVVSGASKQDMLDNLEHIESVFDRDCFLGEMGRLYIGDFYRECFVTSSTKEKVFEKTSTTVQYVATSDEGYWKNEKTVTFSGTGNLTGEIAYSLYVTARVNNQNIIYTPLDDKTAHFEYGAPWVSDKNWIKFDIGKVIDVNEFSGITLHGSQTQVGCDVQISDGTTIDDARTLSATALTETAHINIVDFTEMTIDSFGQGMTNPSLIMYGYKNNTKISELTVKSTSVDILGEALDVSEYDYVTFRVGYSSGTTTINYTVNEEQWTTIDTITVQDGEQEEIVVENVTCRYIRLKGSYFGTINSDVSLESGESVPNRNLLNLGYQAEHCEVVKHEGNRIEYVLEDSGAYVVFDDIGLNLKKIECDSVNGIVIVQGKSSGTWTDIAQMTNNFSQTYNTEYEQIRLKLPSALGTPWTNNLKIWVVTDAKIYNYGYAPSNALIEIKGQWTNPRLYIGGVEYGADIELASGHTLKIDTKDHTVRDYSSDYGYENVYDKRLENDFERVDSGENVIEWSGSVEEIKVTIDQQRSTPKWN